MTDKSVAERLATIETELKHLALHFTNHVSSHKALIWILITIFLQGMLIMALKYV